MSWAIPPLPQHALMVWCSVKHRDNFTFLDEGWDHRNKEERRRIHGTIPSRQRQRRVRPDGQFIRRMPYEEAHHARSLSGGGRISIVEPGGRRGLADPYPPAIRNSVHPAPGNVIHRLDPNKRKLHFVSYLSLFITSSSYILQVTGVWRGK
jgi:hypothetical protein